MEFDTLVVSFLVDEVVGGFFISVPPGYVACVYDRGRGVLPRVWGPGLHLKIPFWQVVKMFNAQIIEYGIRENFDISQNSEALGDAPINATSQDGEDITIEGSILFRIDRHNAPELWENLGENVVSKVVRPVSRSKIANVVAQFTLEEIKQHRQELEQLVQKELNDYFKYRGIDCEGFLLSRVTKFTPKGEQEVMSDPNVGQEAAAMGAIPGVPQMMYQQVPMQPQPVQYQQPQPHTQPPSSAPPAQH